MGKISNEEKDLVDEVRALRKETTELEGRLELTEAELSIQKKLVARYKKQILEYEVRLGIKQPLQEMALSEYLTRLNDPSTRGKIIGIESGFILTDAIITGFGFKRDWVLFLHYLYVDVSDNEGNNVRLKHYCPKKYQPVFDEMLTPLVGNISSVIVNSTSAKYHFIDGLVKEDGKYLRFDDL